MQGSRRGWGSNSQERVNGRSTASQTRRWRTCRGTRSCGEASACSETPARVDRQMLRTSACTPRAGRGSMGRWGRWGRSVVVRPTSCGAENPRFPLSALRPCAGSKKQGAARALLVDAHHSHPFTPLPGHHGVHPPSPRPATRGCAAAGLRQAALAVSAHVGGAGRHASAPSVW